MNTSPTPTRPPANLGINLCPGAEVVKGGTSNVASTRSMPPQRILRS